MNGVRKPALPQILFCEHHESYAALAFYALPDQSAAVLCVDGVSEGPTASVWLGEGRTLAPLRELHCPTLGGLKLSPLGDEISSTATALARFRAVHLACARDGSFFEMDIDSPYMLLVSLGGQMRRTVLTSEQQSLWGVDLLNVPKSDILTATHVNYSVWVQTI